MTTRAGQIVGGYSRRARSSGTLPTSPITGLIGAGTLSNTANVGTGVTDGYTAGGSYGIYALAGGTIVNGSAASVTATPDTWRASPAAADGVYATGATNLTNYGQVVSTGVGQAVVFTAGG